jgi:hypothetical protein
MRHDVFPPALSTLHHDGDEVRTGMLVEVPAGLEIVHVVTDVGRDVARTQAKQFREP